MGRAAVLIRAAGTLALAAAVATAALAAPPDSRADLPSMTRIVAALGDPGDPEVRRHLEHARGLGFEAVWVHTAHAGRWTAERAPDGPEIDAAFVEFLRWSRERGLRVFAVVSPVATTSGRFRFSDRDAVRRLARFLRKLRRAGVRDFVLAFDDMPTRLTELNDILAYGTSTAPAHLDLARRLARIAPRRGSFWLLPSAYCDAHVGDGSGPYSSALLEGLPDLPRRVGIVWTGPEVISPSITREDLAATRARLGGRRLLLFDNYPNDGDFRRESTGTVLGPLRHRGPDLARDLDAYLSVPTWSLGVARLPLATVADWLRDPHGYDPDRSWRTAQDRLAGDDAAARDALAVQASEWGGWIGARNYRAAWVESVTDVARRLDEPAYVASWAWTARRYPDRMRDLAGVADPVFRDDLLRLMRRRLTIARAIPLVLEWRARERVRRDDADVVLDQIRSLREGADVGPDARHALDVFLEAAGVADRLASPTGFEPVSPP